MTRADYDLRRPATRTVRPRPPSPFPRSLHTRNAPQTRRLGLTTLAFASSGATTLVFNLVLVHVLAADSYGEVARTFALGMAVAQLTMAGIAPAIAREVAHGRDDDQRFARARSGMRALACSAVMASVLYFPLAAAGLGPTGLLAQLLGWALALVYSVYFGLKLLLFALDCSQSYAALELASDVIFFATLVLLALVAPTAGVLTFSVAYLLFIVVASRLIRRRGSGTERLLLDRRLMAYGAWASVATYASVGRFAITVALTGAVVGSTVAGRIAALLAILMPLFLVPQAAAVLTFADVARARAGAGDASSPVRRMCRVSGWVSALTIPTACLFAREITEVAIGAHYRAAISSFLVLVLCLAPQITAVPAGQALAAQGAVVANAIVAVTGFAALLVGIALLVPAHGVLGAAIAFGASMLLTGIATLVLAHIRFGIGLRELAGSCTAVGLGLAATALAEAPLPMRAALELMLLAAVVVAASQITWRMKLRNEYL